MKDQPEALILADAEDRKLLVWDPKTGLSPFGLDDYEPVPTATLRS